MLSSRLRSLPLAGPAATVPTTFRGGTEVAGNGALLGALALAVAAGCASPRGEPLPPSPGEIVHVVLVKLNDPSEGPALIDDANRRLATIAGMTTWLAGEHRELGRTGVVQDYDVGFAMGFDDDEAYLAYLDHPAHVAFVERWRPRSQWLRIYDLGEAPRR
ncbi:MAG TPA: Dabb family protein [Phycisphaerales bacterium]|nr:Dabb family protein [Phycisphaerales bacterium]HMP36690.1 Dabb family protein [Phycisphaerales bacterium]